MTNRPHESKYPVTVITHDGERWLKASEVVSILLGFEDDIPSDGAREILWILAHVFGCALAESPTLALRELST